MTPNAVISWKTTLAGVATLALVGLRVHADPKSISDPTTMVAITTGIGLLLAKDGDVTGTAAQPAPPPQPNPPAPPIAVKVVEEPPQPPATLTPPRV